MAALAAVACVGPCPTQAAAPGYEIQLGVIESDNIQRLPSGGTSGTIGIAELAFDWHEKRPYLDADVDVDMSHLNYFQHTYGSQYIGNAFGQVQFNIVPQLLSWNVSDNFGEAPLNPLAPITPANLGYLNYFSTGPTLSLPLAQATRLNVTGQYGSVNYQQQTALDATRLTGLIGVVHDLSPLSSISLNARDERTDFRNDQLNPDYTRQELFARYEAKGNRTELALDLGDSHLHLPGSSDDTPLARLEVSRRLSASSTVGVALGHDYSDGVDAFRLAQAVTGATLNTLPIIAVGPAFVDSYGTLQWNFKYARTSLNLSATYLRDRYQTDAPLNNERIVVNAFAAHQITPAVQLSLTEYLVRWQFDVADESVTESDTALQLTWRAGPHLSVFLAYYLSKGSGDVHAFNYTENRVWLSVGYGVAAQALAGPAPVKLPGMQ
jgi:hypothetical protein